MVRVFALFIIVFQTSFVFTQTDEEIAKIVEPETLDSALLYNYNGIWDFDGDEVNDSLILYRDNHFSGEFYPILFLTSVQKAFRFKSYLINQPKINIQDKEYKLIETTAQVSIRNLDLDPEMEIYFNLPALDQSPMGKRFILDFEKGEVSNRMIGESGVINLPQYDLKIKTTYPLGEIQMIENLLGKDSLKLEMVSVLPECNEDSSSCYQLGIINERMPEFRQWYDDEYFYAKPGRFQTRFIGRRVPLPLTYYNEVLTTLLAGREYYTPSEPGEPESISTLCYNPRHAILIMNKEDEILGIYEMCFECGNIKISLVLVDKSDGIGANMENIFREFNFEFYEED